MKKLFHVAAITLVLLLGAAHPALTANAPNVNINGYCAEMAQMLNGGSQIELMCRNEEKAAQQRVQVMQASDRATQYCMEMARVINTGYTLYETCLQEETKAERALGR
ncbi:hypothetical protein LJC48_01235 [Desulfovibrio sp. OttesenSCG-928-C06]|nr:hypothetical protein [Desulfovibrio sp. OttesenSCG-928-C06]